MATSAQALSAVQPLSVVIVDEEDPGNTTDTAYNIGRLNSTKSISDFVGSDDTADVYSFSLNTSSNLNISLTDLSEDADVRLLNSSGTEIARSSRGSNLDDSINRASLAAGNYFVEVNSFSGDTDYTLGLSTAKPSNLLPTEFDVGSLDGTQTFDGSVGRTNTADVYGFSVDAESDFSLSLTGLTKDADVRLIQDSNYNSVVDPDELIGSSTAGGSASESITAFLEPGDNYFVQVYQFSGNTNYTLDLTADLIA